MLPYGHQSISRADIDSVREILESDWLTQGPAVERFETDLAETCEASFAVAVSSATAALHVACRALDLGPGDRLWTSPISFVASANCGLYCGAEVDFVDIDPTTFNMSPEALSSKLSAADRSGTLPKVLVVVHMAGNPADMAELSQLARSYGVRVIEDASHAIGATYRGRPVGSCACSDITVFSFHPVKVITTGEGGAAVTNEPKLCDRMRLLRNHCLVREPQFWEAGAEGAWYYEQQDLGYNYRLTDIQAALGSSQLTRLRSFIDRRTELASIYSERLAVLPVSIPSVAEDRTSAWHLYIIRLVAPEAPARRVVYERMRADGIGVNVHYVPIHRQPFYQRLNPERDPLPQADGYYESALTLPLFPAMTSKDQDAVVWSLERAIQ